MIYFTKEECNTIINLSLELEGTNRDINSKNIERPRENISYTYYNIYKNEKVVWTHTGFIEKADLLKVLLEN